MRGDEPVEVMRGRCYDAGQNLEVAWRNFRHLFPPGESFVFAWREEDILLPGRLDEVGEAFWGEEWEEAHIFSAQAEIAAGQTPVGLRVLLWTEQEVGGGELLGEFAVEASHRYFRGRQQGVGPRAVFGEARYPRVLAYPGLHEQVGPGGRLRAEVYEYWGNLRLVHVRYRTIAPAEPREQEG